MNRGLPDGHGTAWVLPCRSVPEVKAQRRRARSQSGRSDLVLLAPENYRQ